MFCNNCGAPVKEGAAFCTACGASTGGAPNQNLAPTAPAQPAFTCPYCRSTAPPIISKNLSGGGWALFAILILFCLPLCWLPFVIEGCKELRRNCASCGVRLG